jgi:hypothetical protein
VPWLLPRAQTFCSRGSPPSAGGTGRCTPIVSGAYLMRGAIRLMRGAIRLMRGAIRLMRGAIRLMRGAIRLMREAIRLMRGQSD